MCGELWCTGFVQVDVERQYNFIRAVTIQPFTDKARPDNRETANHYASNPGIEPGFELRLCTYATTDLYGEVTAIDNLVDDLLVFLLA